MKYKLLVFIALLAFVIVGCSKKSEYNIDLPNNKKFDTNSVSDLDESDIKLIKEYIPMVIKWYNSVNIENPQPSDFIPDKITEGGNTLFENEIYQNGLNEFRSGIKQTDSEKEKFKQISTVNAIYGQIAGVMMTSEMSYSISTQKESNESDSKITIQKDSWIELGDVLKESIEFYYN